MRVYVIYGQGGYLTSMGMSTLAGRIAKQFPKSIVTKHGWNDPNLIINDIHLQNAKIPIAVIGYSLGANDVPIIGAGVHERKIALGVCYDPSQLGMIVQPKPNIERLLLYHNVGTTGPGHEIYTGPQVERTDINSWHLAVCYNETLHLKTLAALTLLDKAK